MDIAEHQNPGGYREVWNLAYPAILTMVSQTVMWTVDSAMVGHAGKVELAAVGLGGILVWTVYSFFLGLTNSINTFVSQNFGAKKLDRCAEYLWQGLYIALAAGVMILALRFLNGWIIDLLRPSEEVRGRCIAYANIRMLSGPFTMMHFAYANFFRGIGNTKTPMKVVVFANLLNIIGDYFLIFGKGPFPAMGVVGAAWATAFANFLSAYIFAVVASSGKYRRVYGTLEHWRPHLSEIKSLLRIGIPIAVHFFLDMGSFLVFSAYIGRMGTEPLAVNQIVIQILALSFMPCQGFSIAATTLMGQYIGARRSDLAKKSAYTALKLGATYSGIVAIICITFPGPLVRIFNTDPVVVSLGKQTMLWAALFIIFDAIQMVSSGALRGAGDTKVPMKITIGGAWFLFIPLAYIFGTVLSGGIVWAWAGGAIYALFLGAAMSWRLMRDRWRDIRIE
ncbi:MAG: MATE family efflux transporter [Candidatus Latescibacteria bacterium]|nr:MATE family efflux transporter [Candidatus Latescibacterota bacterium]NIO27274.1 MATE family efflux transporter [Candidatus Latescibacterota bacterium]NIO54798.1 MATE family efflux transporter [Candidatus Latescibacterota bacterium]NIT00881.1 MATE family efflux transporter [Candidatus Latescibacterota bacterium]NIT37804.1 MATE family efflux transporter [Candidatus Latescibacterota bacterium]